MDDFLFEYSFVIIWRILYLNLVKYVDGVAQDKIQLNLSIDPITGKIYIMQL